MTYAAPSFDYYDDGLVHSHDWSRTTPLGYAPKDAARGHGARQGSGTRTQSAPAAE